MNSSPPRRIKLLPDQLINRIAAGEVVERPSAVLKELLENSLDAGADRLEIEVEGGGKRLIRVRDNGRGLDEDDLLMCLERHATSKISAESDLFHIDTLGFRGEALPSIASVSVLTITSATADGAGHAVTMAGGRLEGLVPAPCNPGTTVEVRNLFFNVPARKKFLKAETTESAHLLDVARTYALSREGLSLTFRDGGREMLAVEARHDFRTRVYRVLGRAAAESLTHFEYQGEGDDLKVSGWLGGPERAVRSSANLFVYVLGRPVRDRLVNRALADGFGRLLPPGTWPTAVIFIDLDPTAVDVNVHPAKAEVRFRQPGAVFSALSAAVSRAVGRGPVQAPESGELFRPAPAAPESPPPPPLLQNRATPDPPAVFDPGHFLTAADSPPWMRPEAAAEPAPAAASRAPAAAPAPEPEDPAPPAPAEAPIANFEELRPLAQLYQSYILAQGARGLYLVDQHAAHERIIFNRLKAALARGLPGQALLFPDTMDLPPQETLAAEKLGPHLARLGFDLQPFGDRTFLLKGAPAILGTHDPWPPLLEILGAASGRLKALEGAGLDEALAAMADSWLYSLACRAAVKAGDKLTLEAMDQLLKEMSATPNGAYCPHGRPAIQLIERAVIEKRFHRR